MRRLQRKAFSSTSSHDPGRHRLENCKSVTLNALLPCSVCAHRALTVWNTAASATFYDRLEKKIMVGAVGVRHDIGNFTSSKCVQRGNSTQFSCVYFTSKNPSVTEPESGATSEHRHEKLLFVLLKEIKFHLDARARSQWMKVITAKNKITVFITQKAHNLLQQPRTDLPQCDWLLRVSSESPNTDTHNATCNWHGHDAKKANEE